MAAGRAPIGAGSIGTGGGLRRWDWIWALTILRPRWIDAWGFAAERAEQAGAGSMCGFAGSIRRDRHNTLHSPDSACTLPQRTRGQCRRMRWLGGEFQLDRARSARARYLLLPGFRGIRL